jgi:hypothetical protein
MIKNLLPGMYMNAEIKLTSLKVNVPSDAIVNYENKITSFISKGKNTKRAIQTGTTENGFTEVISTDNLLKFPIVVKGAYSF